MAHKTGYEIVFKNEGYEFSWFVCAVELTLRTATQFLTVEGVQIARRTAPTGTSVFTFLPIISSRTATR